MSKKKKEKKVKLAAKRALVPKLRFPEFWEAGEWVTKRLGELLLGHPDYGVNAAAVPYSEDLPAYLRITDISEEGYFLCDKKTSVAINATDENYLSEGDIVLARTGASVGKSYKYRKEDGKLVFAGFLIRIKPAPNKLDSTFLFNFLSSQQYWKWVGVTSMRSGQPGINSNEYDTLPLPVPRHDKELSEQQKIADCLSSLDDLVTLETRKLDTLTAHKKGLMQQLFPAEGKTLPERRFSEFRDAGEWKVDAFDEVIEVIDGDRGKKYPKAEEFSGSGYCLFLSAKNVTKTGFKFEEMQFVSKEKDEALRKGKLQRADVVLTTRGTVGQFAYFSKEVPYDNIRINSGMVILRIKTKKINSDYLYAFSKSEQLNFYIKNIAFGNAQQQLTVAEIKKFQLCFPDPEEQQRIADCLTSLDDLITTQTQKLATLKTHKKGLMQQLFPALDEVQG